MIFSSLALDAAQAVREGAPIDIPTPSETASIVSRDEELTLARTIIENAAEAIFHLDDHGRTTFANAAAEQMFGWSRGELIGRKLHDLVHYQHPDGSPFPMSECPLGHVFETGETLTGHEDLFFRKDGSGVAVACSNAAILRDGKVMGSVLIVRDITERQLSEAHRRLLVDELNHRVKNTLSIIQSIARQTFRHGDEAADLVAFEQRLSALSTAHNLLTDETWQAASITPLLARTLEPFRSDADRLAATGPDLRLSARNAVSLALAVHELATNAAKYGALSNDQGRVDLEWRIVETDAGQRLRFQWVESGGPAVRSGRRRGFGSRMIESALAAEFGGSAQLNFLPTGVRFELDAPYRPPAPDR